MTTKNISPGRRPWARVALAICLCCSTGNWNARAAIGVACQMELGNPSNASADPNNHAHYLLQRTVETIDYDDALGEPNWVSWDLTAADFGSSGRNDSFYTDTNLPATFYHVSSDDYTDSGYDRGHMCPSSDRTDNTTDNKLVFYMSNIVPQTADNNGGVWSTLENYCQSLATAGDEILITCGPSGFDGSRIQPSGKVAIPKYTWKIAVIVPPGDGLAVSRVTTATRVIAVKIPNIDGIAGQSWTNYVTSPNQIQADTGLTFFTALPDATASVLRGLIDGTPAPAIAGFTPAYGDTNTLVTINGTNLATTWAVSFNGLAASFTVNSSSQIVAAVPVGAASGPISVTTAGGITTSTANFLITNFDAVTILTQPASLAVDASSNATFYVQADGAPPDAYQWWKDGIPLANNHQLSGVTSNTLLIAGIGPTNPGAYSVVVSNYLGAVTSSVAMLTLTTNPPVITVQPVSQIVAGGTNVTFSVAATGSPNLVYAWRFNGTNILGATQSTCTRANVQFADAGNYSVVITNAFGSVTSSLAALALQSPAAGGIIAQWNFNTSSTNATTGAGIASLVGTTGSFVSGSPNDTNTVNSGWNSTSYAAQGTGNKTRGVQFTAGTRGWQNLIVSWDQRLSNTASKYFRLQYSTNGINFIDGPVITMTAANVFQSQTNFLLGLPGVDDNANFSFRVVAEFESTAAQTVNANYDSTTTNSYGTSGTVRYDLVTISGTPITYTASLGTATWTAGGLQFAVNGNATHQFAVQASTNLITWIPVLTNTAPFTFTDTNTTAPCQFYRAVFVQ